MFLSRLTDNRICSVIGEVSADPSYGTPPAVFGLALADMSFIFSTCRKRFFTSWAGAAVFSLIGFSWHSFSPEDGRSSVVHLEGQNKGLFHEEELL